MIITPDISKGQLVPLMFSQDAVADSQAAVAMNILEVAATVLGVQEYQIPWDYEIVGISVVTDDPRTAGTLTVDATIDGTATGLQAILNATNTTRHYARQVRGADCGGAGSRVGVKLTTSSWTPVTADIVVVVWVLVKLGDI